MRNGRKPRRRPAIDAVEVPVSLQAVAANDQSGIQLPLESLQEPAEILVRVSTDELEAAAGPVIADEAAAEPVAATMTGLFGESSYGPAESVLAEDASLQMRLARIHLRTGSLAMARAQLESLAGRDLLDAAGTLDLAEARWRTGDLHGAGEAAVAYLAANGGEALGFVIASEAATLGGRLAEARRYMDQAEMRMLTSVDSVFAGIPRRTMFTPTGWGTTAIPDWAPAAESPEPAAPAVEPAVEPALAAEPPAVERAVGPATAAEAIEPAEPPAVELAAEPPAEPAAVAPESAPTEVVPEVANTATTGPSAPDPTAQPVVDPGRVQADTEIAAGIALLQERDPELAALHFGIALRMTPESAQTVLNAIGDRRDLALELVRGDALRMLGYESDAGQAYLSVASALSAARTATEPPAEPPATQLTDTVAETAEATEAPESPAAPEEPAPTVPLNVPHEAEGPELRPEPPPINWSD
jgi:hypothetical protein